jgi:hypothetical protein
LKNLIVIVFLNKTKNGNKMTDAPKKRRGRPAKKKEAPSLSEALNEAPAFLSPKKEDDHEQSVGGQKKAGRPKGVKSSPVTNVLEPLCKHCEKSGVKVKRVMKPILSFALIDGKKYNTLTRKYVFCDSCQKHSVLMVRGNK